LTRVLVGNATFKSYSSNHFDVSIDRNKTGWIGTPDIGSQVGLAFRRHCSDEILLGLGITEQLVSTFFVGMRHVRRIDALNAHTCHRFAGRLVASHPADGPRGRRKIIKRGSINSQLPVRAWRVDRLPWPGH